VTASDRNFVLCIGREAVLRPMTIKLLDAQRLADDLELRLRIRGVPTVGMGHDGLVREPLYIEEVAVATEVVTVRPDCHAAGAVLGATLEGGTFFHVEVVASGTAPAADQWVRGRQSDWRRRVNSIIDGRSRRGCDERADERDSCE